MVFPDVIIAWKHVHLPKLEPPKNLRTDGLREALCIQRIASPRRETITSHEVLGEGNELAIIKIKVLARHISERGSSLDELFEVLDGVETLLIERRIDLKNLAPEDVERCRDSAVLETSKILPRLAFGASMATG